MGSPHENDSDLPVFLTWRLRDSLPLSRASPRDARHCGSAFVATDRLLDEVSCGPVHLREPSVADMVVMALQHNANILGHYRLHAFVVMPNHVHLLATPAVELPAMTAAFKEITAERANALLVLPASPFWQEEDYHRTVRYEGEFEEIWNYIEENPVRAGMVKEATEYRWSSASTDAIILQGSQYHVTSIRSSKTGWDNVLTWQDW